MLAVPVVGAKEAEMTKAKTRNTRAELAADPLLEDAVQDAIDGIRTSPPHHLADQLRMFAEYVQALALDPIQWNSRTQKEKALASARARAAQRRRVAIAEKHRKAEVLAAAKTLLDRIDAVEALARKVEAIQGTIMANARAAVDDANAVLSRADALLGRINGADKWLEQQQEVEVERRVRSHLGAEAREMRAAKQEEIKAAKIAVGAALGTIGRS
jgi:hypothetical protein